jgi:hypothetical protein
MAIWPGLWPNATLNMTPLKRAAKTPEGFVDHARLLNGSANKRVVEQRAALAPGVNRRHFRKSVYKVFY